MLVEVKVRGEEVGSVCGNVCGSEGWRCQAYMLCLRQPLHFLLVSTSHFYLLCTDSLPVFLLPSLSLHHIYTCCTDSLPVHSFC